MYYIFLGIPRPLHYSRREDIRDGGGGLRESKTSNGTTRKGKRYYTYYGPRSDRVSEK